MKIEKEGTTVLVIYRISIVIVLMWLAITILRPSINYDVNNPEHFKIANNYCNSLTPGNFKLYVSKINSGGFWCRNIDDNFFVTVPADIFD